MWLAGGILLDGAPNISPNSIGKPTLKGSFKGKTEGKTIDDRVRIRDLFRLTLVSEVSENVTSFTCISVCACLPVYGGLI